MDTLTLPLTTPLLIPLSPPPLSAICLRLPLVAAFLLVAPHQRTGTPPAIANALSRAAHLPALRTQCKHT
jgi:hypothetical protein